MKDHTASLHCGDIFTLPVELAHPTQFAVGLVSADCKRRALEEAFEEGKLKEFLCQEGHLVPVVLGPPGRTFYITDHHHLSVAMWRADLNDHKKALYANVIHDWSDKDFDEFWRAMIENNLAWLDDDKGLGPLNPRLLPANVGELLNDPYRTLSRWVRDCGCYTKDENKDRHKSICNQETFVPGEHKGAYFIEFRWANFLRANVALDLKHRDFSTTCEAMPFSHLYLEHERDTLLKAFDQVVDLIGCHRLREVTYDKHGCLVDK